LRLHARVRVWSESHEEPRRAFTKRFR
jgi:hypothetical protein